MKLLFFTAIFSLLTYISDITTDWILVYNYYVQKEVLKGSLTLTFVLLPCVGVLLDRFYRDRFLQSCTFSKEKVCEVLNGIRDACLIFYTTIKIYCQIIYYSWLVLQRREDREMHYKTAWKLHDDALGVIFYEITFETLPQLILQTILIVTDIHTKKQEPVLSETTRLIAIATSLISISWGIMKYVTRRPHDFSQSSKCNRMPFLVELCNFLGHIFILGANVLALSLAVHSPRKAVFAIFAVRMLIMLTWRKCDKEKRVLKNFSQIALILIGICVPSDDGDFCFTYKSYLLVFGCDFVQNTTFVLVWYVGTSLESFYQVIFILGHYVILILGFFFMILFYCKHQTIKTNTQKSSVAQSEVIDNDCNELSHMPTNTDESNSDGQKDKSYIRVEL